MVVAMEMSFEYGSGPSSSSDVSVLISIIVNRLLNFPHTEARRFKNSTCKLFNVMRNHKFCSPFNVINIVFLWPFSPSVSTMTKIIPGLFPVYLLFPFTSFTIISIHSSFGYRLQVNCLSLSPSASSPVDYCSLHSTLAINISVISTISLICLRGLQTTSTSSKPFSVRVL